jgi:hypothetical protein
MSDEHPAVAVIETVDQLLGEKLARLAQLKVAREELEDNIRVLTMEIEKVLPKSGYFYDIGGRLLRATVVRKESPKVDLHKLRELSVEFYERATKRVFDSQGFTNLLRTGALTPQEVQEVATIVLQRPYVQFTLYGDEDGADD